MRNLKNELIKSLDLCSAKVNLFYIFIRICFLRSTDPLFENTTFIIYLWTQFVLGCLLFI